MSASGATSRATCTARFELSERSTPTTALRYGTRGCRRTATRLTRDLRAILRVIGPIELGSSDEVPATMRSASLASRATTRAGGPAGRRMSIGTLVRSRSHPARLSVESRRSSFIARSSASLRKTSLSGGSAWSKVSEARCSSAISRARSATRRRRPERSTAATTL